MVVLPRRSCRSLPLVNQIVRFSATARLATALGVTLLTITACGSDSSPVVSSVQAYLGSGYQVQGCQDKLFSQGGLHLWTCQVAKGSGGFETWNVAVRKDGSIDDASPG